MRKAIALLVLTIAGVVALLLFRSHPVTTQAVPDPSPTRRTERTSSPSSTARHLLLPAGHRVVTGRSATTIWGPVQVRVAVGGGRILDVRAIRLPHGNELDVQLSNQAARQLRRAVLDSQRIDVDMVSGATVTSAGYLASLQSAIDQVRG